MTRLRQRIAFVLVAIFSGVLHLRAAALLPVATLAVVTPARAGGATECAASYGEYWWSQYWDPMGECVLALSSSDQAAVTNRIQQFESVCSGEANWLYGHDIFEWTGNYNDGYEWEAFSEWWGANDGRVAVHWPYLEDWYILAHEGAHGYNQNSSESFAIGRGNDCTYMLY